MKFHWCKDYIWICRLPKKQPSFNSCRVLKPFRLVANSIYLEFIRWVFFFCEWFYILHWNTENQAPRLALKDLGPQHQEPGEATRQTIDITWIYQDAIVTKKAFCLGFPTKNVILSGDWNPRWGVDPRCHCLIWFWFGVWFHKKNLWCGTFRKKSKGHTFSSLPRLLVTTRNFDLF